MTTLPFDTSTNAGLHAPRRFRWAVSRLDRHWSCGRLTFVLPGGEAVTVGAADQHPEGVIRVRSYRFMARVMASGDIGFAEGYVAGEWDTPDLTVLLTV